MAPKKPVPTPPQKPTAPVTPVVVAPDEAVTPVVVAPDDLPRIINVVHIKSGKPMQVSKNYYLLHKEKFTRE